MCFFFVRFSEKRHPAAFLTFGLGPRNCIGMKFALIELKIALVKLLLNFEINSCEQTPDVLPLKEAFVRRPKDGVYVYIKKRAA